MSSTMDSSGATGARTKLSTLARATRIAEPTGAQVEQAWRALQARTPGRGRRWTWFAIPTFALAAVALLLVLRPAPHRAPDRSIEVGGAVESAEAEVALALPDGIQVDLDRRSRVRLQTVTPEEIRVALGKGSARFDVEPRHPRRFVVDADDVEVKVVGTRFRVTRIEASGSDAARIEVAVERGIVEVRDRQRDGEPHRLRAGERFSMPAVSNREAAATAPPSEEPMREAAPVRPRAPRSEVTHVAKAAPIGARELLEQAQVAWRAGRMAEAAARYEQVLAQHGSDPRAALAALELGRIQMDHLDDPAAAAASLERALKLGPRAAFREDALARLARAYAQLHRTTDCRRARDAYTREYANG
ncbi:MAG TPA: FecR domain-containing protein, partial [Polyangia bacterium]|nr:FecR domain-containing protein [Polyangia bacterium]